MLDPAGELGRLLPTKLAEQAIDWAPDKPEDE